MHKMILNAVIVASFINRLAFGCFRWEAFSNTCYEIAITTPHSLSLTVSLLLALHLCKWFVLLGEFCRHFIVRRSCSILFIFFPKALSESQASKLNQAKKQWHSPQTEWHLALKLV